ncbi:MAG: hypothetical protein Q9M36_03840 [Sulfurovum sp.]|nr:hypothetical protein [Sulfurovum sp.]MDQ7084097.1 hypothetical protein [Sulfurovum sp.]
MYRTYNCKNKHKQLEIIIQALLSMRGRITMLGLSRWSEKEGVIGQLHGSFIQR